MVIAIIGASALVMAALMPAILVALHSRNQKEHNVKVEKAIGTPNGLGNVVEMLEGLTKRADRFDERLHAIESRGWKHRVARALIPEEELSR